MIPTNMLVHVGAIDRDCRPGIVLDPGPGLSRIRVLHPASFSAVGSLDEEGDMPHHTEARRVPNPDGTVRWLLSWHDVDECEKVAP
jgi:hypothetical protein